MSKEKEARSRIIRIEAGVIGPKEAKARKVRMRSIGDYPEVASALLEVSKLYSSPLLLGPPICDELIALIRHMFTEEEAGLVRHLRPLFGKSASELAKAEHRTESEAALIMDRLAFEKRVIISREKDGTRIFYLMPIVPGAFEHSMMRTSMDSLTDWNRGFAALFEALWETGYFVDYAEHASPIVRYVPVGQAIGAHPMALPADQMEGILDRYSSFGVTNCQCRMAEEIMGRGCGRPKENCLMMGPWTEVAVARGLHRKVSKKEALEIKMEAEAAGLVNWMIYEESGQGTSGSCSCCGCCCHMLRTVTEFNAPGNIAPPHFLPRVDPTKCSYCGKCALACPMAAIKMDTRGKTYEHLLLRCIGCGLCKVACDKEKAIEMETNRNYQAPPATMLSLLLKSTPGYLRNAWSVWRKFR